MPKIDPRLLKQLKQLQRDNQSLQGQVNTLSRQSSNQGGIRDRLRSGMRGVFGGIHNPRIQNSKISPLPARFKGRRLF